MLIREISSRDMCRSITRCLKELPIGTIFELISPDTPSRFGMVRIMPSYKKFGSEMSFARRSSTTVVLNLMAMSASVSPDCTVYVGGGGGSGWAYATLKLRQMVRIMNKQINVLKIFENKHISYLKILNPALVQFQDIFGWFLWKVSNCPSFCDFFIHHPIVFIQPYHCNVEIHK